MKIQRHQLQAALVAELGHSSQPAAFHMKVVKLENNQNQTNSRAAQVKLMILVAI